MLRFDTNTDTDTEIQSNLHVLISVSPQNIPLISSFYWSQARDFYWSIFNIVLCIKCFMTCCMS